MTLGTRRILHLDDGPESITNGIPNQKLRRLGEQHESPPEDLKCDGYFHFAAGSGKDIRCLGNCKRMPRRSSRIPV